MLLKHFFIGKTAHSFLGHLDRIIEAGRVVDFRHQLIDVEADTTPDPAVDDYGTYMVAPPPYAELRGAFVAV